MSVAATICRLLASAYSIIAPSNAVKSALRAAGQCLRDLLWSIQETATTQSPLQPQKRLQLNRAIVLSVSSVVKTAFVTSVPLWSIQIRSPC